MPATNPASKIHIQRYIRNRAGETVEEIAKHDHVTERAVQNSLRIAGIQRAHLTPEFMREGLIGVVMDGTTKISTSLLEALEATTPVEICKDGKTETVMQPDHKTRFCAIDRYVNIATTAQPRGPASQTNVNVGVGVNVRQASGAYVGMEDRLRTIRQQMKEAPQLEARKVVGNILDAPTPDMPTGDDEEGQEGSE